MKDEALKLALEALESAVRYHGIMLMSDPPQDAWKYHKVENKADQAITAIKEALAQPEQHQDWCASLTQMLMSMPPKPAPCNCKPKPEPSKPHSIKENT